MGAAGTERFGSVCRSEAKTNDVGREEEGGRKDEKRRCFHLELKQDKADI